MTEKFCKDCPCGEMILLWFEYDDRFQGVEDTEVVDWNNSTWTQDPEMVEELEERLAYLNEDKDRDLLDIMPMTAANRW